MPIKENAFIPYMNVSKWIDHKNGCAEDYDQKYYWLERYGTENDCCGVWFGGILNDCEEEYGP